MTDRAAYIAGLRKLADALEQNEDLPLPGTGSMGLIPLTIGFWRGNAREAIVAASKALRAGPWKKDVDDDYFDLAGKLDGLHIKLSAHRDEVCVRRVVGVEDVEVEERQGEDTRPVVKRTETREVVAWECPPLLADRQPSEVTP